MDDAISGSSSTLLHDFTSVKRKPFHLRLSYLCNGPNVSFNINVLIFVAVAINYFFSAFFVMDILLKLYGIGPVKFFIKHTSFFHISSKVLEVLVSQVSSLEKIEQN